MQTNLEEMCAVRGREGERQRGEDRDILAS